MLTLEHSNTVKGEGGERVRWWGGRDGMGGRGHRIGVV